MRIKSLSVFLACLMVCSKIQASFFIPFSLYVDSDEIYKELYFHNGSREFDNRNYKNSKELYLEYIKSRGLLYQDKEDAFFTLQQTSNFHEKLAESRIQAINLLNFDMKKIEQKTKSNK